MREAGASFDSVVVTFVPHQNSVEQIDKGLYGALIIDPQDQQTTKFDKEFTMVLGAWQVMDGVEPGGLMQLIQYEGYNLPAGQQGSDSDPTQPSPAPTMPANMPGMQH